MSAKVSGEGEKLLSLEVMRFLTALVIVVHHYRLFLYTEFKDAGVDFTVLAYNSSLHWIYDYGLWGVQVFWGLSGYIFFWKYHESISRGLAGGYKFFVLRFSRLYPLHVVTLVIAGLLEYVHVLQYGYSFVYEISTGQLIQQIFMANQWFGTEPFTFNGPSWSVCTEVLVYLLFFMQLRYLGGSLLWLLAILVVCLGYIQVWEGHWYYPVVYCVAYFYAGGVAALLSRYLQDEGASRRSKGVAIAAFCGMPLAFVVSRAMHSLGICEGKINKDMIIVWGIAAMLLLMVRYVRVPRILHALVEVLGNLTYSSYLCHFPMMLGTVLVYRYWGYALPVEQGWFLAAYVATVFSVAYVVYYRFEKRAQEMLRRQMLVRPRVVAEEA